MQRRHVLFAVSLFVIFAAMLAGHSSWGINGAAAAEKEFVFGVSVPQLDADGFRANVLGLRQKADEIGGIKLVVYDALQSVDNQTKQIEDFITQKVDAIIFIPVDSAAMASAVLKANKASIPVITIDRSVEGGETAGLVESDNYAHGARAADLMKEIAETHGMKVSDLKVLELLGALSTSSGQERHDGFADRAKELGIPIIAALPTEYMQDLAYNATMDGFQAHSDINAIYEASDIAMSSGVESALRQINKLFPPEDKKHIIITTVDGGPAAMNSLRAGFIDALAQQQILGMSHQAVELAYKILNGGKPEQAIIRIPPHSVTKENVDDPKLWPNTL
jgi:ABC-type sugar transport system substrate-binding protein